MGDRIVIARQRSMSRRATRGQTNPRWDFLRPLDVRCVWPAALVQASRLALTQWGIATCGRGQPCPAGPRWPSALRVAEPIGVPRPAPRRVARRSRVVGPASRDRVVCEGRAGPPCGGDAGPVPPSANYPTARRGNRTHPCPRRRSSVAGSPPVTTARMGLFRPLLPPQDGQLCSTARRVGGACGHLGPTYGEDTALPSRGTRRDQGRQCLLLDQFLAALWGQAELAFYLIQLGDITAGGLSASCRQPSVLTDHQDRSPAGWPVLVSARSRWAWRPPESEWHAKVVVVRIRSRMTASDRHMEWTSRPAREWWLSVSSGSTTCRRLARHPSTAHASEVAEREAPTLLLDTGIDPCAEEWRRPPRPSTPALRRRGDWGRDAWTPVLARWRL